MIMVSEANPPPGLPFPGPQENSSSSVVSRDNFNDIMVSVADSYENPVFSLKKEIHANL